MYFHFKTGRHANYLGIYCGENYLLLHWNSLKGNKKSSMYFVLVFYLHMPFHKRKRNRKEFFVVLWIKIVFLSKYIVLFLCLCFCLQCDMILLGVSFLHVQCLFSIPTSWNLENQFKENILSLDGNRCSRKLNKSVKVLS